MRLHSVGWDLPTRSAAAVVFLVSDEASFVTGAELHVDGCYTALGHVHRAADGSHVAGDEQP